MLDFHTLPESYILSEESIQVEAHWPWVRTATLMVWPVPLGRDTCTISDHQAFQKLEKSHYRYNPAIVQWEQATYEPPYLNRQMKIWLNINKNYLMEWLTVARSCWSVYLGSMLRRKWASTVSTNLRLAVSFTSRIAASGSYSCFFTLNFWISKYLFDLVCKTPICKSNALKSEHHISWSSKNCKSSKPMRQLRTRKVRD